MLTTALRHLTRGLPPLTFSVGSKVPTDYWGRGNGEEVMEVYRGTVVRGCVDKNTFGKFGLVHAVQVGSGCLKTTFTRFSRRAGVLRHLLSLL